MSSHPAFDRKIGDNLCRPDSYQDERNTLIERRNTLSQLIADASRLVPEGQEEGAELVAMRAEFVAIGERLLNG